MVPVCFAAAIVVCSASGAGVQPTSETVELPVVNVTADDTVIDRSCRVVIAPGVVIRDAAGDGVIHVRAPGITVEFGHGSVLRGSDASADPDAYAGVGIRVENQHGVTLRGARVEGFKVGLRATGADGLLLEDAVASDLWRHRLRSTPVAEDAADWLWPHRNDAQEWVTSYGAAFCIERSRGVTVRRCTVREGQNGLMLDRVSDSKVYDNDFSFLSGWGVSMWRSCGNTISRNALDFCVRGYSHGVYNRGQDSAGILMFEQCSDNVIAENSATHGGDGFFGFGGREALGEVAAEEEGFDCTRKGCNDNLLIGNDFSYAPAHGIEMTFSFGNEFIGNRLVENAICGVWGGYSQETHIAANEFTGNGLPGRSEGGGINIEHGYRNLMEDNTFRGNTVAVSLWWDNDEGLLRTPWAKANYQGSVGNDIRSNIFEGNTIDVKLRRTTATVLDYNARAKFKVDADEESDRSIRVAGGTDTQQARADDLPGETRPVGARAHLRGRDKIIMGEWGPWDHRGVLVRDGGVGEGGARTIEVFGAEGAARAHTESAGITLSVEEDAAGGRTRVVVTPREARGVTPYEVTVTAPGLPAGGRVFRGTIVAAAWAVRFFPWTIDPREDLVGWREEGRGEAAVAVTLPGLELAYAGGGPGSLACLRDAGERPTWRDRFGTIATTTLDLPRGRYRLTTLSDDGVRVTVAGLDGDGAARTVIENWTWHGPTRDAGEFVQGRDGAVTITVEHFEIDGHAVLEVGLEPVD